MSECMAKPQVREGLVQYLDMLEATWAGSPLGALTLVPILTGAVKSTNRSL